MSLREQLPVAVLAPLPARSIVQAVLPSFCTAMDPVGDPEVPDATVAEIPTAPSLPNAAVGDDTDKVVELVAGKTERGTVSDAPVKLASPG